MRKPETKFRQDKVDPFLKTLPRTFTIPITQVARRGDPDYVMCINGKFVSLELKDDGEEPRPLQEHRIFQIQSANGVALVSTPSTWESTKLLLRHLSES